MKRTYGLDLMRAVAILAVLASHGYELFLQAAWPGLEWTTDLGGLGVSLFFALSGFLIGRILLRAFTAESGPMGRRIARFWGRRWLRTLPNYYLFLGLNVALAAALFEATAFDWRYLLFLQNLTSPTPEFFQESWSLAVEEAFYLTVPLLAAAFVLAWRSQQGAKAVRDAALVLVVVSTVTRLAAGIAGDGYVRYANLIVLFRLDGIGYGMLLAYMESRQPERFERSQARYAALGAALLGLLFVLTAAREALWDAAGSRFVWMEIARWNVYVGAQGLGPALLLPLFARAQFPAGSRPFVTRTSLYAYSLYLAHMLVGQVMVHAVQPTSLAAGAAMTLAWLAVTYLYAGAVFHGFEKPVLAFRDRWIPEERKARPAPAPEPAPLPNGQV